MSPGEYLTLMDDLLFFYPTGHEEHSERGHPERPGRIEAIKQAFENAGLWDQYPHAEPAKISEAVLHGVHDPVYLKELKVASQKGQRLDMETYITPASWQLALNAAGGAIAVAEAVWKRAAKRGFAFTRPPGHHATPNQAMGFCLINNIAVAAEHLLQTQIAERLAIIDIDLHHGNGTQDIFYSRGEVFYFSTHQYPLYPGTGALDEIGTGAGEGRTVNIPLPPYSGNQAFTSCLHSVIFPLLDKFKPQMLLISAGFDAHWRDPLGNLLVSTNCYGEVVAALSDWADINCQGRIALFLEGGYDLEAGAQTALASSRALLGQPWDDPLGNSPTQEESGWQDTLEQAKVIWDL